MSAGLHNHSFSQVRVNITLPESTSLIVVFEKEILIVKYTPQPSILSRQSKSIHLPIRYTLCRFWFYKKKKQLINIYYYQYARPNDKLSSVKRAFLRARSARAQMMLLGPQITYMPSKSHVIVLVILPFLILSFKNEKQDN